VLEVTSNIMLNAGSRFACRIGPGGSCGMLSASGTVLIVADLDVTTNGYDAAPGFSATLISAPIVAGGFLSTNAPTLGGGREWVVTYTPTSVVLSVTNSGGSPTGYDLYVAGVTNGLTGYADDADGDGFANLLEYATGANPTNLDTLARMEGTRTNGLLALRFLRNTNATDAMLVVEGAGSIVNGTVWAGLATNAAGSWGSATNVTETGAGSPITVTVTDSAGAATNRYLRLRVMRP
jgi:hypothetical protein